MKTLLVALKHILCYIHTLEEVSSLIITRPYCVKPYQFCKGKRFALLVSRFLGPEIRGEAIPSHSWRPFQGCSTHAYVRKYSVPEACLVLTPADQNVKESPKGCLLCPAQCLETREHRANDPVDPFSILSTTPPGLATAPFCLLPVHTFVGLPGFVLACGRTTCWLWEREIERIVRGPHWPTPPSWPGPKRWWAARAC